MEEKELAALYQRHYADMVRQAMTLLNDDEDSRDAVAEIFATIARTDTVIMPKTEKPFLLRCVRNQCFNMIRKMSTRQRLSRLITLGTLEDENKDEGVNEERLRRFMHQWLSPKAVTILYMRFADNMKYNEIAEALNISEAAVYKYLSQSLTTIRNHFKLK